jgi:signal transduction histidine kinase
MHERGNFKGVKNHEASFKNKNETFTLFFPLRFLEMVISVFTQYMDRYNREKRRRKRRNLRIKYERQRMEALDFSGGIAHDFNNLLMGIQGRTS